MTTRQGAARLQAWRQSPFGQAANATNIAPQIFAQTIDAQHQYAQNLRRAIQGGLRRPAPVAPLQQAAQAYSGDLQTAGLSAADWQLVWAQRRAEANGVSLEEQLASEAPEEDRPGFFGRVGRDLKDLGRGLIHVPEAIAGMGVDVGQYAVDTAQDLTQNSNRAILAATTPQADFVNRAGAALDIPGFGAGVQEAYDPDDYTSSRMVVDSFHRTANRLGAAATPWRDVSQRKLSEYVERPLLTAVEDVANVASVAAPVARGVAGPLRPGVGAATRGPLARGIADAIRAGEASSSRTANFAAGAARRAGRAAIAIDEAPLRGVSALVRGGGSLARRVPAIDDFITRTAEGTALRRGFNRGSSEAIIREATTTQAARRAITQAVSELELPKASIQPVIRNLEGAHRIITNGVLTSYPNPRSLLALWDQNPALLDPILDRSLNQSPLTGTQKGLTHFDIDRQSLVTALDYVEGNLNPTLSRAIERADEILRGQYGRRVGRELTGEGRKAALDPAELGRTQFNDYNSFADFPEVVQTRANIENAIIDARKASRSATAKVGATKANDPTFGQRVAAAGQAKQELLRLQDELAKHDAYYEQLRLDTAQIPERFQSVWEMQQAMRGNIEQAIVDAQIGGAPPNAIALLEQVLAEIPINIVELENAWLRNGVMLEHINRGAFDVGRNLLRVERTLTGVSANPLSRVILPDAPVNVRRPLSEKIEATAAQPSTFAGRGMLEIEQASRVSMNEMVKRLVQPYLRTAQQLLDPEFVKQLAANDPNQTGVGLSQALREGDTLPQTVRSGTGRSVGIRQGEEWVPYSVDDLFPGSPKAITPDTQVYVPRWVAESLRGVDEALMNAHRELALRFIDKVNDVYRHSWLALSPRWHVGNMVSNAFMMWQVGQVSVFDMPRYINQARGLLQQAKRTGALPTEEMTALFGHNLSNDLFELVRSLTDPTAPGLIRKSYAFNSYTDNVFRTANYLAQMGDNFNMVGQPGWRNTVLPDGTTLGVQSDAAIRGALRVAGDFNEMTRFERRVIRRILPFYAWYRHVTKLILTEPIYSPIRTIWTLHLGEMFYDPEDYEALPGFMQTAFDVNGTYLSAGGLIPYAGAVGENSMFTNPAEFVSRSTNPAFQLAGAGVFGTRRLLGGEPVTDQLGLPTGALLPDRPQDFAGFAYSLAGGPFTTLRDVVQPQSRTPIGTERVFNGEPQEPLRNPLGVLMSYLLGVSPYNEDVDFEEIREQQDRSAHRDRQERERRQRQNDR